MESTVQLSVQRESSVQRAFHGLQYQSFSNSTGVARFFSITHAVAASSASSSVRLSLLGLLDRFGLCARPPRLLERLRPPCLLERAGVCFPPTSGCSIAVACVPLPPRAASTCWFLCPALIGLPYRSLGLIEIFTVCHRPSN